MRHFLYKTFMVMCAAFILSSALPLYAHACCPPPELSGDSHLARQDCCPMESCSVSRASCEIRADHVDDAIITADCARGFFSENLHVFSSVTSHFITFAPDLLIPPAVPIGRPLHVQISSPLLL